jgi:hypothetical protein
VVAAFHVHLEIGWFRTERGMEAPLYLLVSCVAILVRDGGARSAGGMLGREI